MQIYRECYIENGQMWVRYTRTPPRPARRLRWFTRDINGRPISAPLGIEVCSPNNWLRRILYFFGASRQLTRRV